jgi:hypothetical protein
MGKTEHMAELPDESVRVGRNLAIRREDADVSLMAMVAVKHHLKAFSFF